MDLIIERSLAIGALIRKNKGLNDKHKWTLNDRTFLLTTLLCALQRLREKSIQQSERNSVLSPCSGMSG